MDPTHDPALQTTERSRRTADLLAFGLEPEGLGADELAAALPQYDGFEPIGAGGMGVVWRARHVQLDRTVAIKLMRPELDADQAFAERFAREARALARLQHPNIVGVHDYGEVLGRCYLVMEHVDGTDLRSLLDTGLSSEQALAIVPQLCDALQYAHEEGIVHRDIKPENILVDRRGRVRIADFGLAKLRETTASRATSSGRVLGTAHYMAPEQIDRPGEVDHRADIFALGVVFYEMLTGKLPIGRFELPSRLRAVDVGLDDVVLRALEHDRERRFQHVSEVKERMLALAPVSVRAPSAPDEVELRTAKERTNAVRRGFIPVVVFIGVVAVERTWFPQGLGAPNGLQLGRLQAFADAAFFAILSSYAWILYGAYRHRDTPRGAVMSLKLALGLTLSGFGLGVYSMIETVAQGTFLDKPLTNGVGWIFGALAMLHAQWTAAVEKRIPLRLLFGPVWWIPRWEAEQQPRAAGPMRDPSTFRAALLAVPPTERDAWCDHVLGLDGIPEDGPELPRGGVPYLPCPVDALLRVVEHAGVDASDVFVDVGAGIGRAAVFVHLLTGARTIGLEIQPGLVLAARELAARMDLSRCTMVEGDAPLLPDAIATGTVFFLYCPFGGARLGRMLEVLEAVARRRPIRVACVDLPLPACPWLTPTSRADDLTVYRS